MMELNATGGLHAPDVCGFGCVAFTCYTSVAAVIAPFSIHLSAGRVAVHPALIVGLVSACGGATDTDDTTQVDTLSSSGVAWTKNDASNARSVEESQYGGELVVALEADWRSPRPGGVRE